MDKSSAAFMSYARFDDEHNGGQLTNFRKLLSGEVRAHTGLRFDIFQDTSDIALGQDWKGRICAGIDECALFLPIITPSFFTSAACRYEFERFLERERELGRKDLILPVYYITCPVLDANPSPDEDALVNVIRERNYFDLRELRGRPPSMLRFRTKLTALAMQVVAGLDRSRAMRKCGEAARVALTSGAHGAAGLALVGGACAAVISEAPTHSHLGPDSDDQAAEGLHEFWERIRHYFAAVECMQKDA